MDNIVLYSTNVALKLLIQEQYQHDVHYVWCSESFDADALAKHTVKSKLAPSSSPAKIYRDLQEAVRKGDQHCAKITEQRASFVRLATQWFNGGRITSVEKTDILYTVKHADMTQFSPLLYVIPRHGVLPRLQPVPAAKRASMAPEAVVPDLLRSEFDIIEY